MEGVFWGCACRSPPPAAPAPRVRLIVFTAPRVCEAGSSGGPVLKPQIPTPSRPACRKGSPEWVAAEGIVASSRPPCCNATAVSLPACSLMLPRRPAWWRRLSWRSCPTPAWWQRPAWQVGGVGSGWAWPCLAEPGWRGGIVHQCCQQVSADTGKPLLSLARAHQGSRHAVLVCCRSLLFVDLPLHGQQGACLFCVP